MNHFNSLPLSVCILPPHTSVERERTTLHADEWSKLQFEDAPMAGDAAGEEGHYYFITRADEETSNQD